MATYVTGQRVRFRPAGEMHDHTGIIREVVEDTGLAHRHRYEIEDLTTGVMNTLYEADIITVV